MPFRLSPRRWHHNSTFGQGDRVPLDREQRAKIRAMLFWQRLPNRLTPAAHQVGLVLLNMLGADGRLDPTIETICRLVPFGRSAVIEALTRLRQCGFLTWVRRLVRSAATGWRTEQTSNAYVLRVPDCEFGFRPRVVLRSLVVLQEGASERPAAALIDQTEAEAALKRAREAREVELAAAWQAKRPG